MFWLRIRPSVMLSPPKPLDRIQPKVLTDKHWSRPSGGSEVSVCQFAKFMLFPHKPLDQVSEPHFRLTQSLNISVQLQLVITFNVSNSLDPISPGQNAGPDLDPNCSQMVISR